jgi:hypothetical protein
MIGASGFVDVYLDKVFIEWNEAPGTKIDASNERPLVPFVGCSQGIRGTNPKINEYYM